MLNIRKPVVVGTILCGVTGILIFAGKSGLSKPSSSLQWDSQVFDAGLGLSGQLKESTFQFTNYSGRPVEVQGNSCCSAALELSPSVVNPGQRGIIRTKFIMPGKAGKGHKKFAFVAKGQPALETALEVTYESVGNWSAVPAEVHIGPVREGSRAETQLCVYLNPGGAPITSVQCADPRITVKEAGSKPGDFQRFNVGFEAPSTSHETVGAMLEMRTADPHFPSFAVPVHASIAPCVRLSSRSVRLGEFRTGSPRTMSVTASTDKPKLAVSVLNAPDWLSVRTVRKTASNVALECRALRPEPGIVSETIKLRVTTDHVYDIPLLVTGLAVGPMPPAP